MKMKANDSSNGSSTPKNFIFPNGVSEFTYMRTYSRWDNKKGRRETYPESVERLFNFYTEQINSLTHKGQIKTKDQIKILKELSKAHLAVLEMKAMPSMRALWSAGEPALKDNTCIYNCAFVAVNNWQVFSEILHVLMCGTGVGFSVETKEINQLPYVATYISGKDYHTVEDSREGWANSLKTQIYNFYFQGKDTVFDYSNVRGKGERLNTMGGRASGPEPLKKLHDYVREVFLKAEARQLTSLEVHDIICQIAEVVVVGGVRRSSLMSLSDLKDDLLRGAKVGWEFPVIRYMANNSAVYEKKPSRKDFDFEWDSTINSGTGERGFFNREGGKKKSPRRRNTTDHEFGVNPCAEILLRSSGQFCNLSEVVVRSGDTLDDLILKIESATWIGAIQSTFTDFPYLRDIWKKNCEEERLLGVSLTGQMDNPELLTPENLKTLKKVAVRTARKASKLLGINMPTAITTTKPSGTVSILVDSSAGIHPRYAPYYVRRIRISSSDPLFKLYEAQGMEVNPENGQSKEDWDKARAVYLNENLTPQEKKQKISEVSSIFNPDIAWTKDLVNTWVIAFPVKAPEGAITRNDKTAIEQLEHYKNVQANYAEHSVSATIYYRQEEVNQVADWVFKNWKYINGLSFLPAEDGNIKYKQAPYEEISKETYELMVSKMPEINYSLLSLFEKEDFTEGAKEYACVGGACMI